jgi:hypothetical protein
MNARKTVLVIFPDEINACIAQFPCLATEATWLCLTIDALDRCLQLRLPQAEIPSCLHAAVTFSADEHMHLFSKLQGLEESFIEQRNSFGFHEHAYWNHQHNMTMLTLLFSAQKTAALAAENLSHSASLLMPQRMGVGDYHYPGGLLTAIVKDTLQRAGFQVETIFLPMSELMSDYSSTVYSQIPNYWSSEMADEWMQSTHNVIVSPSGLFYQSDQQKLLELLQKLGVTSKTWMLAPPFWNVIPDGSGFQRRISVQLAYESLNSSMQQALMSMVDGMTSATVVLMRELLGDSMDRLDFFHYQIQRIKQRHFFQSLTFFGVSHLCMVKPMDALVVTNLDGGINGPLFSAARDNAVPCFLLPHSHVVTHPTEEECTVITEYWQPKPSISHRGQINLTVHMPTEKYLENPKNLLHVKRNKKVLILFNGIHRWTSINMSLNFLKNTVANISEICAKAGVELAYRLKPGDQTPLHAYTQLLNLDPEVCQRVLQEPLDVLMKNTELVIAIDDPSSALWEAIELGCAVVLIANRPFIRSTLIDQDVLKSHSPEEGLSLIGQLLSDKDQLDQMRLLQFSSLHALREMRLVNGAADEGI